jgi:hypothetical protein
VDATTFESEPTGQAYCAPGESCSYACGNAADCRGLAVICEAGSSCAFTCSENGAFCPTALCEEGAACSFDCEGAYCNEPVCENVDDCDCLSGDCEIQTP